MYRIKLNANENPFNADEELLERILKRINNLEFNRYPTENSDNIRELFAAYLGVDKDNVTTGNGSDEVLRNLISFYLESGDDILFFANDFGMYTYYAKLHGVNISYYEIQGDFDVEDFIGYIKKTKPKMFIFSNPNNPTGRLISNQDIKKILDECKDLILVADEAYIEFAKASILPEIANYENLFVTRTMSKALGMASLRVGVCVSNKENIAFMEENKAPYNVNALSQAICNEVFTKESMDLAEKRIDFIISERDRVYKEILAMDIEGLIVYPSKANFIYFESKKAREICQAFDNAGILIRDYGDRDNFRITIGKEDENNAVLDVFRGLK